MSYAGQRLIYDADSHLMELPDFLSAHSTQNMQAKLPDLTAALTGRFDPNAYAGKQGHSAAHVARLVALGNDLTKGPKCHHHQADDGAEAKP